MKYTNKFLIGIAIISSFSLASTRIAIAAKAISSKEVNAEKIKLVNDTEKKVNVHTGTGSVTLNPRGGSTSFTCNPGKAIKADGKEIFKVTEKMCGQTIKLSSYL